MSLEDNEMDRRILRGEISGDQAVLKVLEDHGLGDSERAEQLRRRIAEAM